MANDRFCNIWISVQNGNRGMMPKCVEVEREPHSFVQAREHAANGKW